MTGGAARRAAASLARPLAWAGLLAACAGLGGLVAAGEAAAPQAGLVVAGCTVALAAVAAAVAARRPWLFHLVLAALVLGTLIGDRSFAHLSVPLGSFPLYVTDATLALLLLGMALHGGLRAELAGRMAALAAFLPFFAWGGLLLLPALPAYGIDAVKDFAIFYYALFLPVGALAAGAGRWSRLQALAYAAGCVAIVLQSIVIALTGRGESLDYGVGFGDTRAIAGQSGMYLTVGLLVALSLAGEPTRHRRWLLAFAAACLVGVYLGQQRSAWIAIALGGLVVLLLHPGWRSRLPRLAAAPLLGAALVMVVLTASTGVPQDALPPGVSRFASGVLSPEEDPTARWRLAAWSEALSHVAASPLTGDGLGAAFSWNVDGVAVENRPHNTYLTILLKSGLPGLLLLALPLAWLYRRTLGRCRDARLPAGDRSLLVGLLAGHLALSEYGGLNLMLESPYLAWLYWALTGALIAWAVPPRQAEVGR